MPCPRLCTNVSSERPRLGFPEVRFSRLRKAKPQQDHPTTYLSYFWGASLLALYSFMLYTETGGAPKHRGLASDIPRTCIDASTAESTSPAPMWRNAVCQRVRPICQGSRRLGFQGGFGVWVCGFSGFELPSPLGGHLLAGARLCRTCSSLQG